ncbi:MAG: hypothetical protein QM594_10115 [Niabella sp.]
MIENNGKRKKEFALSGIQARPAAPVRIKHGTDYIQTDRPGQLLKYLGRKVKEK